MAKVSSHRCKTHFAGFDLSTATTGFTLEMAVTPLDPTTIGDAAERVAAGIRVDNFDWSGIFDDSTAVDAAGSAMLGSGTRNALTAHIGTAVGSVAYGCTAVMFHSKIVNGVKELVLQEAMWKPDGAWDRGSTQFIRGTIAGSGSSGSIDYGVASSTTQFKWYIQLFLYSGGGSTTITLQDSADGISYAGISSVGLIGSASTRDSFITSASGTVRRYTRIIKNATGTIDAAVVIIRS